MTDPKKPDRSDEIEDADLDDVAGGAMTTNLLNTDGLKTGGALPGTMSIDDAAPKARCGIAYQCPE